MGGLCVFLRFNTCEQALSRVNLPDSMYCCGCCMILLSNIHLIFLQCTSPGCHHTKYHTPAYKYINAEALLVRIRAHKDKQYIPKVALDAPLHPATQPINCPDGRIDCSNPNCFTRSHQCTQGNCNCISYFCGPCCKDAKLAAINSNSAHPKCAVHKQDPAMPAVLGLQLIAAYQHGPPTDVCFAPPPANIPGPVYPPDPVRVNQPPYQPPIFPPNPVTQYGNIDPALVPAQPLHDAPATSNQVQH
jgi:hypothetical protein